MPYMQVGQALYIRTLYLADHSDLQTPRSEVSPAAFNGDSYYQKHSSHCTSKTARLPEVIKEEPSMSASRSPLLP